MEALGARLGLHLNRARTISSVLGAVVGGQHAEFGDGIQAGINIQGAVTAIIHAVAAIDLPVVVLRAAAVHAELHVAENSDSAFILSGLIADSGSERDQLGEIASVKLQLRDLFS